MSGSSSILKIHLVHATAEDPDLIAALEKQLHSLAPRRVAVWHEHNVIAGAPTGEERRASLESADVILLLVSADFLASEQCSLDTSRALQSRSAVVIPVLWRPCRFEEQSFAARAFLPSDGRPVTVWENRDAALHDVVVGIARAREVQSQRGTPTSASPLTPAALSWIHLSDLLHGPEGDPGEAPDLLGEVEQDLGRLHGRCGPWDMVVLTGNLTRRGAQGELRALDRTLSRLGEALRRLGSDPVLLAVPGERDFAQPAGDDLYDPVVRTLLQWEPDIREYFWRNAGSPYRRYVATAFADYVRWWDGSAHGFREPETIPGLLPGDFSARLEKPQAQVAVIGLNTAFRSLRGGTAAPMSALHTSQYEAVCRSGDLIEGCSLALLVTRAAPATLDTESREEHLLRRVAPPGRFALQLSGPSGTKGGGPHRLAREPRNGGGEPHLCWEGAPLAEASRAGSAAGGARGYSVGRIEAAGDRYEVRFWPRRIEPASGERWEIVADDRSNSILRDEGTAPERIAPRMRPDKGPKRPTSVREQKWAPRPPRGAYCAQWYVRREAEEKQALNSIRTPGQATVIWGSAHFGKSWLAEHVIERLQAESPGASMRLVRIDLSKFASLESESAFLGELLARLTHATRSEQASRGLRMGRFEFEMALCEVLKAQDGAPLVLFIESLDKLTKSAYGDGLLEMFRALLNTIEEPWPSLRLIVVHSHGPAIRFQSTRSPFFNATALIRVLGFSAEQTRRLASLYRLDWDESALDLLRRLVDGHPLLQSVVMHHAKLHQVPLEDFATPHSPASRALREQVRALAPTLEDSARREVKALLTDPNTPLSQSTYFALRTVGFVEWQSSTFRILGDIPREILRELTSSRRFWVTQ